MLGIQHPVWNRTNKGTGRMLRRGTGFADAFLDVEQLIRRTDQRTAARRSLRRGTAAEQQRESESARYPAEFTRGGGLSQEAGSIAK
jgi:hypothetical protein